MYPSHKDILRKMLRWDPTSRLSVEEVPPKKRGLKAGAMDRSRKLAAFLLVSIEINPFHLLKGICFIFPCWF